MKKFLEILYVLTMGILILSLSGCSGSSSQYYGDDESSSSNLMSITSTAFKQGESYNIYRGSDVQAIYNGGRLNSKYYVSPDRSSNPVSLNLEFSETASNDTPFAVTLAGTDDVVFYFNPSGSGNDTTTSGVVRFGGKNKLQEYNSLSLSSSLASSSEFSINPASIEIDESDLITITLSSGGTATYSYNGTSQGSVKTNDFIWAISSDQPGEYWVQNGTKYFDEDDLTISKSDGLYIARDIRYVPDTLSFSESQTKPKAIDDTEQMYVAYYSTKADGVDTANKYIVAALPASMAMGGGMQAPNGNNQTPPARPASITSSASDFSSIVSAMTHSASEAYNNPVLHITAPGTYKLTGTWNGQIWVDIPDYSVTEGTKTKKDGKAQVALILDNVTVNCGVAPALVFKKVYECGPDDSSEAASSYKDVNLELMNEDTVYAGAIVIIADGSTNTFTGTNVARLNGLDPNDDDEYSDGSLIGQYVKAQDKLYKFDGAFYSRMSMVIGLEKGASSGTLNINSDYEGLASEMHLLINSGTINITADDDGINVNEDDTSVFYMEGGTLTVKSSGGDGIDSNGYFALTSGTLYISAGNNAQGSAGESGIDVDRELYISDDAAYYWAQAGSTSWTLQNNYSGDSNSDSNNTDNNSNNNQNQSNNNNGSTTVTIPSTGYTDVINNYNFVTYNGKAISLAAGDMTDSERAKVIPASGTAFRIVNKVNNFAEIENAQ